MVDPALGVPRLSFDRQLSNLPLPAFRSAQVRETSTGCDGRWWDNTPVPLLRVVCDGGLVLPESYLHGVAESGGVAFVSCPLATR